MKRLTGAPIAAHPDSPNDYDLPLEDGEEIDVGEFSLRVLHVPGHTPDHVLFYCPQTKVAITGDHLFVGKIGGTATGGRVARRVRQPRSTCSRKLPDETTIWPGHDYGCRPSSTIGIERTTNPFLLVQDFDAFLELKRSWADVQGRPTASSSNRGQTRFHQLRVRNRWESVRPRDAGGGVYSRAMGAASDPLKRLRQSVVKVMTVSDPPDYEQPWQTLGRLVRDGLRRDRRDAAGPAHPHQRARGRGRHLHRGAPLRPGPEGGRGGAWATARSATSRCSRVDDRGVLRGRRSRSRSGELPVARRSRDRARLPDRRRAPLGHRGRRLAHRAHDVRAERARSPLRADRRRHQRRATAAAR